MKVPLFDIDWTLIAKDLKRNVHDEAFYYALEKVYKTKFNQLVLKEGWIDNQILLETLSKNGLSLPEAEKNLPKLTQCMVEYFSQHMDEGTFRVLPGVKELLIALNNLKIPVGLLTGNVEQIGWSKLEKAGLRNFFQFGAFGNEVYKRVDLIPLAKGRAEKILNKTLSQKDLVIIGDTPLDVACAKAGGIASIAVASGPTPKNELLAAGADLVIDSLEDKERVISFLQN